MKKVEFNVTLRSPESLISFYLQKVGNTGKQRFEFMAKERMIEIFTYCINKLGNEHSNIADKAEAAILKLLNQK